MERPLLSLPAELLCCILRLLPTLADLNAAARAHRTLRAVAASPSVLQFIADERWRWRLRKRDNEGVVDFCARCARAPQQQIYFLGGENGKGPVRSVDAFIPQTREMTIGVTSDVGCRIASAAGTDGMNLFLLGGLDETDQPVSLVTDHRRCNAMPALPHALCFGAADFDASGRLWFSGGGDSPYRGARVESTVLVLDDLQWRVAGHLHVPRCGHALAYDGRTSIVYSAGGYGGGRPDGVHSYRSSADGGYHDTVETFDMHTGQASLIARHMTGGARTGPGAAIGPDGCLYVVGGSANGDEHHMLSSCERYDPRRGVWEPLPPLPTARGYLAATFGMDGVLYAAGGARMGSHFRDGSDAFEAFDPRRGTWEALPPLPRARASFSAALILPA